MIHQNRILEAMCAIQQLCTELETVMNAPRQEGRMATLEEAQQADTFSVQLMDLIHELPEAPWELIESDVFRQKSIDALQQATDLLRKMLFSEGTAVRNRRPRGAAGRLRAYAAY